MFTLTHPMLIYSNNWLTSLWYGWIPLLICSSCCSYSGKSKIYCGKYRKECVEKYLPTLARRLEIFVLLSSIRTRGRRNRLTLTFFPPPLHPPLVTSLSLFVILPQQTLFAGNFGPTNKQLGFLSFLFLLLTMPLNQQSIWVDRRHWKWQICVIFSLMYEQTKCYLQFILWKSRYQSPTKYWKRLWIT